MICMLPILIATFLPKTMVAQVNTLFVKQGTTLAEIMRKWTKNPRGITLLQRMGMGFIFHILVMVTASLTEMRRLGVAKDHGVMVNGGRVPLSIFILLPQFVLMGVADAFLVVAQIEFFYDQAP
ncbi:hypothetical protein IFM89_010913 [Coptis chinensis]|uniref:Uncharacterized protein n=1 Tax=Coptis chinensis TaxID=261450 RepID=A0A835IP31_9MAGN|nr:hypothetical protein IFM89_010913 [Coptis chinensis]